MRTLAAAALLASLALPVAARAQTQAQDSTPRPSKYKNVTWYEVVQTAFKPGKMDDAMHILKNYYVPAAKAAGVATPVMILEEHTGPWDLTLIWRMKDGPASMEWKESPEDAAWYGSFVKLAGSKTKADALQKEFMSDLERGTSSIALQENDLLSAGK